MNRLSNFTKATSIFLTAMCILTLDAMKVVAQSDQLEKDAERTARYLAYLQRPSALEPAGSLGSFGLPLGLAFIQLDAPEEENMLVKQAIKSNEDGDKFLNPRLLVSKGTDWPIDFGLSVGQVQATDVQNLAAFFQITVFEDFGLPAISVRGFWSTVSGLQHSSVEGRAVEIALSQGVFGYFNAYGSFRLERSDVTLTLNESDYYGLSPSDDTWRYEDEVNAHTYAAGLKINLAPTLNMNCEFTHDNEGYKSVGFKLGMLL